MKIYVKILIAITIIISLWGCNTSNQDKIKSKSDDMSKMHDMKNMSMKEHMKHMKE